MMAGNGISRTGSAGIPRDIEDREKKTVVWYTSLLRKRYIKNKSMIATLELEG